MPVINQFMSNSQTLNWAPKTVDWNISFLKRAAGKIGVKSVVIIYKLLVDSLLQKTLPTTLNYRL